MTVLMCANSAQAQTVADCTKYKKFQTQTEVNFEVIDPLFVTEYSLAKLGEKREKYFYEWRKSGEDSFWIADDENMGGYFMAGLGASIDFALKAMPYEGQPHLMCVYIEKIRVDFLYSGTVFLDRYYDTPECAAEKQQALAFMNKRYVMGHGVVDEKQVALNKDFPSIIEKLEHNAIAVEAVESKIEQIKTALENGAVKYPLMIQEEIEKRSLDLKEDTGIAGRWSACSALAHPQSATPSSAVGPPVPQ